MLDRLAKGGELAAPYEEGNSATPVAAAAARHKVLYDLSCGANTLGFAGIPQDTRLLFYHLAMSSRVDLTGLLRPYWDSFSRPGDLHRIDQQAILLGAFMEGVAKNDSLVGLSLHRLHPSLTRAWRLLVLGRHVKRELYPMHEALFDAAWRRVFDSTLPASARALIRNQKFVLSKLGSERIVASALLGLPLPRLDTRGYDFVLTQDVRPIRPTAGTVQIIRYHDGIPITAPEIFASETPSRLHHAAARMAEAHCYFVCNTASAQRDLAAISPIAAERSSVIPYFIAKMSRVEASPSAIASVATSRVAPSTLPGGRTAKEVVGKWMGSRRERLPTFILSLATLEPRKNFNRLIEAWQVLRHSGRRDLKLMIVGKPGWRYDRILAAMRPHVEEGTLLHLQDVAQHELPLLYSGAALFAFPSIVEGFGMPPTEAMQCACPVLLSDIPAHRDMAGEAAIYHDPYDVPEMARQMACALDDEELRRRVVADALRNVQRYTTEAVLPAWEQLFDALKARTPLDGPPQAPK